MTAQMSMFDGIAERDRIIASMKEKSIIYLTALRSFARVHCMRHGTVTVDDVRAICQRDNFPLPKELGKDERILGPLFACPDFVAVDQQLSRRPERIARSGRGASLVTTYRLRGSE